MGLSRTSDTQFTFFNLHCTPDYRYAPGRKNLAPAPIGRGMVETISSIVCNRTPVIARRLSRHYPASWNTL